MTAHSSATIGAVESLSVGDVAARLGVSPSTVRMWGSRYGLTASTRTDGGHRRYTAADLDRLSSMHAAVIRGEDPAVAAASVSGRRDVGRPRGSGGPGGPALAVPGAGRAARGLARAVYRLDEIGAQDAVSEALSRDGTVQTWDSVVRPVLVAAGDYWARSGNGIEIEHLLTQSVLAALIQHTARQERGRQDRPVLLAGAPHEEHTLALHAVRAALAERGVPSRLLGPRTPSSALGAACRRTRAPAVFVWLSTPDPVAGEVLLTLRAADRRALVVVGGPGWPPVAAAHRAGDLSGAVSALERSWRDAMERKAAQVAAADEQA